MPRRFKTLVLNLSLLVSSLLLSLLLGEALIRAFYGAPAEQLGHHQLFMEYDPLLGWRKIPHVTGRHVTSEYAISERMNSKGIRGPEYPYQKRRGAYRILILGDSFAEGYTVEFSGLFSEVLQDALNHDQSARHYEVINMGVGGYSTDQELLLFQTEGKKYTPDLTILMFYDNDVWYNNQANYPRGHKPSFHMRDDGSLRLTNVPVPRPEPPNNPHPSANDVWKNPATAMVDWIASTSSLYQFIAKRIEDTPSLHHLLMKSGLMKAPARVNDENQTIAIPNEFRVYERHENSEVSQAWRLTEALLAKLKEETALIGSQLLIFYIPMRANVYLEEWQRMKTRYGIGDADWTIEQISNRLIEICRRHSLDCIDPVAAFREEAGKLQVMGKRLYFTHDGHWTAAGHKFAAEMLGHYILAQDATAP
jgi:GDSL-like Lipase/Acylhydrolase family